MTHRNLTDKYIKTMNILQIDKIYKILQIENVLKLERTEAHVVSRITA